MKDKIRREYTNEITCPECGQERSDSWEADEGGEHECECGCVFTWERNVEVTYSTKKRPIAPKVRVLTTIQFANRLEVAHLSSGAMTLCKVGLFGRETPGWSRGGGQCGGVLEITACHECVKVAHAEFPGAKIAGGDPWVNPISAALDELRSSAGPTAAQRCASVRLANVHPCDDFGPRPGARCLGCGHGRGCEIGKAADQIIAVFTLTSCLSGPGASP